jgi:hypothetical protein
VKEGMQLLKYIDQEECIFYLDYVDDDSSQQFYQESVTIKNKTIQAANKVTDFHFAVKSDYLDH